MNKGGNLTGILFQVGAVILALLFTTLVLVIAGANPWDAYFNILSGAFSSFTKFADVIVAWIPLLIVTAALLVTFTAGLWNIGIEGQIMMGAIFTTGILRILQNTETAPVSYTHLRAHETPEHLVCRLLLEKKKKTNETHSHYFTLVSLAYHNDTAYV